MGSSRVPGPVSGPRKLAVGAIATAIAVASLACGGGKLPTPASPSVSRTVALATNNSATRLPGASTSTTPSPRSTTTVAANATAAPTTSAASSFETTHYTVKAGDTAGAIAEQLGVPLDRRSDWIAEMLSLNGVSATALQIGQELILPPTDASVIPAQTASSEDVTATAEEAQPTATDVPQPTDTPEPTKAPAGSPTKTPTQIPPTSTPPPTATPDPNRLELVSVTSPTAAGSTATLTIAVAPHRSCRVAYNNPSGTASTASGLGTKTADDDGQITWTWQLSPNEHEGTGTASVLCGTKTMNVSIVTTAS